MYTRLAEQQSGPREIPTHVSGAQEGEQDRNRKRLLGLAEASVHVHFVGAVEDEEYKSQQVCGEETGSGLPLS